MSMCELSNIPALLSTSLIHNRLSKLRLYNLKDHAESLDIVYFHLLIIVLSRLQGAQQPHHALSGYR